jgi:hypothetical protein
MNPQSQNATLDGTGSKIGNLTEMGFFSPEKQKYLWGDPVKNIVDLGIQQISSFSKSDFDIIASPKEVNSIRLYQVDPDYSNLTSNVYAVIYPVIQLF